MIGGEQVAHRRDRRKRNAPLLSGVIEVQHAWPLAHSCRKIFTHPS
jgi:hypothetical protein